MIVVAIMLSNAIVAAIAVAIAMVGLFFLIRDWRTEGSSGKSGDTGENQPDETQETPGLQPDYFEPDVSYEEAVETADDFDDFELEPDHASGNEK